MDQLPTGEALTGSQDSKVTKAPTGSVSSDFQDFPPVKPPPKPDPSRSQCAKYKDLILLKIGQGLSDQRIYQDLVADHVFTVKSLSENSCAFKCDVTACKV
jgi:hypothetical protein